jgi:hypothetical protein
VATAGLGQGLAELALMREHMTEVAMGLGVIRLQPDRPTECGDRLGQLPLAVEGVAELVLDRGEVGLDRLTDCGDRLGQLPGLAQDRREAIASASFRGWPRTAKRLKLAAARSGLSRIASRYGAIASASFPWSRRARPRL